MVTEPARLTLYGRHGCHLCADARALLDQLALRMGFSIDEVDIDADAALLARYDVLVPVIALGELEIARAPLDPRLIEHEIAAALGAPPGWTSPRPLSIGRDGEGVCW